MKIQNVIKLVILAVPLFVCASIFAAEPDWQKQNADLSAQQANTAAQQANTAAQNADTASQNANTAAQNADTQVQNANTAAQNADTARRMITPVPAPKETVAAPAGFINCLFVEAGWVGDSWIPKHRVCKYTQNAEGVAWIDGYWACTKQQTVDNVSGTCVTWDWKPGHWVKTYQQY